MTTTAHQSLQIRESILRMLRNGPETGFYSETIQTRIDAECIGHGEIEKHLGYLEDRGLIRSIRETLKPSLNRYTISEKGTDYLESNKRTVEATCTSEATPVTSKPTERSAVLKAIAKSMRAAWAFFVWLFTEIF
ncbi:hypothetical protein DDZ13_07355 [Coraliomargarita sinensis]|uniref:Uncharacterized protein n=1 Tax=Coraliomargarita sinensis TaxID=2174842 RepID=A0A317ZLT3_9BACT|nr:hypothetical protein [Coraliomargarita sinensis]PXA04341.1 hypothetical protein DDZ13_07355 [Coraliomargarita sinensis]